MTTYSSSIPVKLTPKKQKKGMRNMRNFTWNCFRQTGSIEAFLLYKELEAFALKTEDHKEPEDEEEEH